MSSNIPDNLKDNWASNEIVMPVDTNSWASSINKLAKAVPLYAHTGNYYTATYSSNTYNLSPLTYPDSSNNVSISGYFDGMSVCFICPADNLADSSINVNSLGTKSIKTLENLNIPAGKLQIGCFVELKYDSNNNCFKFIQDLNKQDKLYSGTNIKTIEGISLLGSGNIDILPPQEGNEGKYLSTDGVVPVWANSDWGIRGIINDGNLDANGHLDLFDANVSFDTTYEYSESGTYTVTIPTSGTYQMIMVGGGGNGSATYVFQAGYYPQLASGGSGAGFSGTIYLDAGTYTVVVGKNGENTTITNSSSEVLITAGAGGNGQTTATGRTAGAGGTLLIASGVTANNTLANNGSGNSGTVTTNTSINGGNSVYDNSATGYGAGGKVTMAYNGYYYYGVPSNGLTGYFKLVVQNVGSTDIKYKVTQANPLTITDFDGKQTTFYSLNTDLVGSLADGTYNKFLDDNGSELIKNTIYAQLKEPTTPSTNDVWIRTTDKVRAFKYDGADWQEYNKVWLGSVDISSGAVSNMVNAELCNNNFNVTTWQLRNYRELVKIYNNGSSWYKIYKEYNPITGAYAGIWAECGDLYYAGSTTAGDHTIAFPFVADDYQFTNTNYTFTPNIIHNNNNGNSATCYEKYTERTKTTAILHVMTAFFGYAWTACGYVEEVEEE